MEEQALALQSLDLGQLIGITGVAGEPGGPTIDRQRSRAANDAIADPVESILTVAATALGSDGTRGTLQSLVGSPAGRHLDRRAWLALSGGAIALTGRPVRPDRDLDPDTAAWRYASSADDAAFTTRLAPAEPPFAAVHGDAPEKTACDVVHAAADLLCRFGPDLDDWPRTRPDTPVGRAARVFALELQSATPTGSDTVSGWIGDAETMAEAVLARLPPDQRVVISARLGLENDGELTLERTGELLGITREQVRQVERKALRSLELAGRRTSAPIGQAVALLLWHRLTQGRMFIDAGTLTMRTIIARLPRGSRLLLAMLGNPRNPLTARTFGEYLTACGSVIQWKSADFAIPEGTGTWTADLPLPNRLDIVVPERETDNLRRHAIAAEGRFALHRDHVVPRGSNVRHRRAAEAASLLRSIDGPFIDLMELLRRHERAFGHPRCAPRTYSLTLSDFPHLLVEGASFQWATMDDGPPVTGETVDDAPLATPLTEDADASPDDPDDLTGTTDRTVADRIETCLREEPVLRIADLVDRLGDVTQGTVAGISSEDPTTRWYAPGLLALLGNLDELVSSPPAALLSADQWRQLSDALRSGERHDDADPLFPAWSGNALDVLLRWGRGEGLRLARAREQLRDDDLDASHSRFAPRHLVAMTMTCCTRPSIGWMRINRLLGKRTDSREAIWPIALLGSLGLIQLDEHWQHPLVTDRDRAVRLRSALFALARTRTELSWNDVDLQELLGRFDIRRDTDAPSVSAWLEEARIARFLDERLTAGAMSRSGHWHASRAQGAKDAFVPDDDAA